MAVERLIKLVGLDRITKGGIRMMGGGTYNALGWAGTGLCTAEYFHAYRSLEQAAFMSPIYGYWTSHMVLDIEGEVGADDGSKVGCHSIFVIGTSALLLPTLTNDQRIATALLAVPEPTTEEWALDWLSGGDRSKSSAEAAAEVHPSAKPAAVDDIEVPYEAARSVETRARKARVRVGLEDRTHFVYTHPHLGKDQEGWTPSGGIDGDGETNGDSVVLDPVPLQAVLTGVLNIPDGPWGSLHGTYSSVPQPIILPKELAY